MKLNIKWKKSIIWNYIDSYWYNIGCSSFYCGWRWYQRFHFQYYCSYIGIGNVGRNLYNVKWNQKL